MFRSAKQQFCEFCWHRDTLLRESRDEDDPIPYGGFDCWGVCGRG
jgi:hypothetical protein